MKYILINKKLKKNFFVKKPDGHNNDNDYKNTKCIQSVSPNWSALRVNFCCYYKSWKGSI